MANRTDIAYRRQTDLDRAARRHVASELPWGWPAMIVSSTLIPATTARYLYQWTECQFAGTAPYAPSVKTNGMTGQALSISELGNGATVAYGVTFATIGAGFSPVKIPDNTPVWIVPARAANGASIYLIVNAQAIDGACP